MDKQITELPGTRIDTLWSTVKSGTNEDGTEYENKQRIAPRTFEEAVTDENGVDLKTKLAGMRDDIDSFVAGELPDNVLFVSDGTAPETPPLLDADTLQGHGADYFATKDELYMVPEGEKIHFKRGEGNADYTFAVGEKGIKANTALESTSWVGQVLEFIGGAKLVTTTSGFKLLSPQGFAIAEINDTGMFCKQVYVDNDHAIWFNGIDKSGKFRLFCSGSNDLVLQYNNSGTWTDIIVVNNTVLSLRNTDTSIFHNLNMLYGGQIHFYTNNNTFSPHLFQESNNNLYIYSRETGTSSWVTALRIDNKARVYFQNAINAPNIVTTAALTAAEQEITEHDLALIAAEQANTDLDLRLTALEAKEGLNGV